MGLQVTGAPGSIPPLGSYNGKSGPNVSSQSPVEQQPGPKSLTSSSAFKSFISSKASFIPKTVFRHSEVLISPDDESLRKPSTSRIAYANRPNNQRTG